MLHILGGLDRGGAETWLMHVLRHIDRNRFHFDFMVHTEKKCAYDEEAMSLGARIIPNLGTKNPFRYALNFIKNYRRYGPYDVVHSHVHHYSGFVLFLAKTCRVPNRISHSHNDTRFADNAQGALRQFYLIAMKRLIKTFSSDGVAASAKAAESLYGMNWRGDMRWRVIHYGVDFTPFEQAHDKRETRKELGLPENAFLIGHVGRFHPQKNHAFLISIAEEIFKRERGFYLLLVGDGPLRKQIEADVEKLGVKDRVIFAGVRDDVARLMKTVDVFVFPSIYEGLGIVLLEAQAAGLQCVVSDIIPEEADVIKEHIVRLSLNEPPEVWARTILAMRESEAAYSQRECVEMMKNSRFNIENCVRQIEELYIGSRHP